MKLQYLGTAAAEGFPALFCECDTCRRAREAGGKNLRMRTGLLVNDTALIDFPPDVMAMMQYRGVRFSAVRDIFVSHSHSDHLDVEDLVMRRGPVFCVIENDRPIHVHMNAMSKQRLDDYIPYEREPYDGYMRITVNEYFKTYEAENGVRFTFLPADHAPKEQAGFYVIEDGEKTAVYANDTGFFPEETMAYLKTLSIDFLSLDCTYGPRDLDRGHMGIPANRRVVKELREAGALKADATIVIHHFTHNCGLLHEELEREVEQDGFLVSYDGMIVEL